MSAFHPLRTYPNSAHDGRMTKTIVRAVALAVMLVPAPAAACLPPSVSFPAGSYRLGPEALAEIEQVAASWRHRPNQRILLAAGADRVGSAGSNLLLSRRRGEVVKDALVRRGVPGRLISIEAHGESEPFSPTADGIAEPLNRRVWLTLVATPGCAGGP